jgi:hypothetical protein
MANTTYIPYRRFGHTLFREILVLYRQVTLRTLLVHSMEKRRLYVVFNLNIQRSEPAFANL